MSRALVLGGGGVGGIAWETGVLAGLAEAGVSVLDADRVIGTSAGAAVAAQLFSAEPVEELFARQVDGRAAQVELPIPISMEELTARFAGLTASGPSEPLAARRALGAAAAAVDATPLAARRAVIAARLPHHSWPAVDLRLVAVDTATGIRRAFTSADAAPLVDVVAASCAIPLVWPAVPLAGGLWMDGGAHSAANADLAAGQDVVLVLAPMTDEALAAQVLELERTGSVLLVSPDAEAQAMMGPDPLDLTALPGSAQAGRAQGLRVAERVAQAWQALRVR